MITLEKYKNYYDSTLGRIHLLADTFGLCSLGFSESEEYKEKNLKIFDETKKWLDCYFSKKEPSSMPKLSITGTKFQMMVWEVLKSIPYGKTMTYGEVSRAIARKKGIEKMSAQAIGSAIGANKILILIPCHRIINSNGKIGGYNAGIERKIELLKLENILIK